MKICNFLDIFLSAYKIHFVTEKVLQLIFLTKKISRSKSCSQNQRQISIMRISKETYNRKSKWRLK